MNCPHCNKKMEILYRPDALISPGCKETVEVLGRCEDCDFDATWIIDTYPTGAIREYGLKKYFFG